MILRTLLVVCAFLTATPSFADSVRARNADSVTLIKNGQPIMITATDRKEILDRLVVLFNSNSSDTTEPWLRMEFEKDGHTLAQKWDMFRQQSLFSVTFPEEQKEDNKKKKKKNAKKADIAEVIVTINNDPNQPLFGTVMAQLRNGEIRGYKTDTIEMINLYCMDRAQKYLPAHYNILAKRYSDDKYVKETIYCSTN